MSLAYGAPSYPPSSPYGNQHGGYDDESYMNEYNLAREQLYKRRSVRQVELTDGHLVLEVPVPRSILQFNQFKGNDLSEESGKMRYTAVTEDPDEFTR
jgi:chitin synthase